MKPQVFLFDGPIGVGKTSLGQGVAERLALAFIDGDDHCKTERWLDSSLQTNKSIASLCIKLLDSGQGVIVAYPVRRTNWIFFKETFARLGYCCRCIGLIAQSSQIAKRERVLSKGELARSMQVIKEGYGQRSFCDLIYHTDKADLETNCVRLADSIRALP